MTIAAARFAVRQVDGRHLAMGLALPYLAARQPFAAFQAGELTRTVAGQILRGHYLMAFEGARLVGYLGWACYSPADAAAYAASLEAPPDSRANGQGVVWLLMAAATMPEALDTMLRDGRRRYAGWRAMGVRHRRNGRVVVFDQPIRLRDANAQVRPEN
ncbi:hypothetical protein AAFN86_13970 [Roseomonas sp. CAU 1739]|uniref:hypothetical protein n=1 Tax=Roseomonas sp. CAU 1739 TaxID=3140364 RepID=UPI00325B8508